MIVGAATPNDASLHLTHFVAAGCPRHAMKENAVRTTQPAEDLPGPESETTRSLQPPACMF
jgi:hypothetical protein